MLLLSPDQVEFCKMSRHDLSGSCLLDGIAYRDKLFYHIDAYPVDAQESALRKARQRYNDIKGEKALIVLGEAQKWSVWEEDSLLSIYQKRQPSEGVEGQSIDFLNLDMLADQMHGPQGVKIQDRMAWPRRQRRVFLGRDAVEWMARTHNLTAEEALRVGNRLIEGRQIYPIPPTQGFQNDACLYRFYVDEVAMG